MGLGLGAQDPQSEGMGFPQAAVLPWGGGGVRVSRRALEACPTQALPHAESWGEDLVSGRRCIVLHVGGPPQSRPLPPLAHNHRLGPWFLQAACPAPKLVFLSLPGRSKTKPGPLAAPNPSTLPRVRPSPCAEEAVREGQRSGAPPHILSRDLKQVLSLSFLICKMAIILSPGG